MCVCNRACVRKHACACVYVFERVCVRACICVCKCVYVSMHVGVLV